MTHRERRHPCRQGWGIRKSPTGMPTFPVCRSGGQSGSRCRGILSRAAPPHQRDAKGRSCGSAAVRCWLLDVRCSMFDSQSDRAPVFSAAEKRLVSSRQRIPCRPANGCRIQTALPPGGPAPAGAVAQFAGANGGLAAQTPALGRAHHLRPRGRFQGNRAAQAHTDCSALPNPSGA